jgi:hypothetical protein
MRKTDRQQTHLFGDISKEQQGGKDHPPRPIWMLVDEIVNQPSTAVQQDIWESSFPAALSSK